MSYELGERELERLLGRGSPAEAMAGNVYRQADPRALRRRVVEAAGVRSRARSELRRAESYLRDTDFPNSRSLADALGRHEAAEQRLADLNRQVRAGMEAYRRAVAASRGGRPSSEADYMAHGPQGTGKKNKNPHQRSESRNKREQQNKALGQDEVRRRKRAADEAYLAHVQQLTGQRLPSVEAVQALIDQMKRDIGAAADQDRRPLLARKDQLEELRLRLRQGTLPRRPGRGQPEAEFDSPPAAFSAF